MAAPAAAAAALVPLTPAIEKASQALTADLIVFSGKIYRKVEAKLGKKTVAFLEPIDLELHVNPLTILLGVGALGVAALASIIAWNGLRLPGPLGGSVTLFSGLKDTALGTIPMGDELKRKCAEAKVGYEKLVVLAGPDHPSARDLLRAAKELGCLWARFK